EPVVRYARYGANCDDRIAVDAEAGTGDLSWGGDTEDQNDCERERRIENRTNPASQIPKFRDLKSDRSNLRFRDLKCGIRPISKLICGAQIHGSMHRLQRAIVLKVDLCADLVNVGRKAILQAEGLAHRGERQEYGAFIVPDEFDFVVVRIANRYRDQRAHMAGTVIRQIAHDAQSIAARKQPGIRERWFGRPRRNDQVENENVTETYIEKWFAALRRRRRRPLLNENRRAIHTCGGLLRYSHCHAHQLFLSG